MKRHILQHFILVFIVMPPTLEKLKGHTAFGSSVCASVRASVIAPDKAAYCVFTQFRGPENAIKLISMRTKTQ